MTPGTVLFDKQFRFNDGTIGQKLIVLLTDGNGECPYLVIKTTSKQKRKQQIQGCNPSDLPHNFYIPANTSGFKGETWLLLEEVYPITLNEFFQKRIGGTVEIKDSLSKEMLIELLDCALQSQDIMDMYLRCIEDMRNRLLAA